MGYTIDIDTGGTFTDGFITCGDRFRMVKTPTTPHDLTLCFWECIKKGAESFSVSAGELLSQADVVRFSNTIGTNAIIQRDGAKIGLLVTKGWEELAPTFDSDGKRPLVEPEMVIGIEESCDLSGSLCLAPEEPAVLTAAQCLLDRGARCLVVCFRNSEFNAGNERMVREVIKKEYPRSYLGSVPIFISAEISHRQGYPLRINASAINAYIHGKLTRLLYKSGEQLRNSRFPGQLLIGDNNGSAARTAKTRAIDTYNSGPAAGLIGAQAVGALYGADFVVSADMGGTSFDIGFVRNGEPSYSLNPNIEGFDCNVPMLSILALGAGGGSIAAAVEGQLEVGPRSAGALPGPACFDLGGTEPTVTDANLVLGLLDPEFFLGGQKRLHAGKAAAAIEKKVAGPLGITVHAAARLIKGKIDAEVGRSIGQICREEGRGLETLMVIYGGAGPLHACDIAERSGIRRIVITPFSAVFSAYSSSLIDVGHLYRKLVITPLEEGSSLQPVQTAAAQMKKRSIQDMRGEGFAEGQLDWQLELIVRSEGSEEERKIHVPLAILEEPRASARLRALAGEVLHAHSSAAITIVNVGVRVTAAISHFKQQHRPRVSAAVEEAIRGTRRVYLGEDPEPSSLPVYDRARLGNGHRFRGPVLVDSEQTTVLVNAGWCLRIDEYDNALLEREEDAS